MDNEAYFDKIKNLYDSLSNFEIRNNILIFHSDKDYVISLNNVNLSTLNPNVFQLKPNDIQRLLFILEILPKEKLTDAEKNFIIQYTKKYLKLEHSKLANEEIDDNTVYCLGIPIYLSDDPRYENSECSNVIHEVIQEDLVSLEAKGKSDQKKLVLTNPQFVTEKDPVEEKFDNFTDYTKAGFTTILLIAVTIIATCLYFAFYVAS